MPTAKTHDAITVVTGIALAPLTYVTLLHYGPSTEKYHWILRCWWERIMFSPDLDIASAIDNRWGPFYWIWRPYMWVVPHGSRLLSHGLIFPPLLCLLYLFAVSMLVFLGAAWVLGQVGIVVPDYHLQVIHYLEQLARTRPHQVGAFLVGFITGGAAHSIADLLTTYHTGRRHR